VSWQHRDLAPPEAGDTAALASDGERDAVVRVPNEAFAEGRLTPGTPQPPWSATRHRPAAAAPPRPPGPSQPPAAPIA
jgi:hypothetical protein